MSDDALLEARTRASHAKDLLEHELLTEAFEGLKAAYIAKWQQTAPHEERAREILYLAVNAIGKVREHLQAIVNDGKIADAELNHLIEREERKKLFGLV